MWQSGPFPAGTWCYGAVVLADEDPRAGFRFARFAGTHAILYPCGRKITPEQVVWWCNPIPMLAGAGARDEEGVCAS